MIQTKDAEYLSRPLISDVVYIIEDDYVRISFPSTIHADAKRLTPLNQDELLSLYKSVFKTAKAKGVKISYSNHFRKQIIERWGEYESSCTQYIKLFTSIIEQAKIVQSRGLHIGTRDDEELGKLHQLCSKYGEHRYRNNIVSQISDIYECLIDYENDLSDPDIELIKICA